MAGAKEKVTGKAKETAGKVTGDKEKKSEGMFDQAVGKVKEVAANVKDKAEDLAHDVKGKMKD